MKTFFAVCYAGGPISVEITASSIDDAVEQFEAMDARELIDDATTEAEDELDIEGADQMDEEEFAAALESSGCDMVRDLSPIHNYHSGQSSHLAGGWMLWARK